MSDPAEAYRAAKAAREANQKILDDKKKRTETLPDRLEQLFPPIIEAMKLSLPPELSMDARVGLAGHLGKRGVKGIFLTLSETGKVFAQASFNCRDDEVIVCEGYPAEGDKRPNKPLGQVALSGFTEARAKAMLADLITHYLN